jgi:RNA polymerase sigma factor (sigma-70 family)
MWAEGGSSTGAGLDGIEAVYRRRLSEFRRVAAAIAGSREIGDDAVQDAFARAVFRRHQFRGEGSLDAWLWRIVVHAARDAGARVADRSSTSFEEEFGRAAAVERTVSYERGEIHALLASLPERQRHTLFLRYYADLDYGTIGDVLEISSGTVGATLNQALENLRQLMAGVKS